MNIQNQERFIMSFQMILKNVLLGLKIVKVVI